MGYKQVIYCDLIALKSNKIPLECKEHTLLCAQRNTFLFVFVHGYFYSTDSEQLDFVFVFHSSKHHPTL